MTGALAAVQAAPPVGPARVALATVAPVGVGEQDTPLLTVSGLSVSYGQLRALEDVDLSVRPANSWRWPPTTARARPPWSAASPGREGRQLVTVSPPAAPAPSRQWRFVG